MMKLSEIQLVYEITIYVRLLNMMCRQTLFWEIVVTQIIYKLRGTLEFLHKLECEKVGIKIQL